MEIEIIRILHEKTFSIPIISIRELKNIRKIIPGIVYVYKIRNRVKDPLWNILNVISLMYTLHGNTSGRWLQNKRHSFYGYVCKIMVNSGFEQVIL